MRTKRSIRSKPKSSMVHFQKSATLLKYTREVSPVSSQKTQNNWLSSARQTT